MIDKSLRYKYQWGGPGGKSPGTSASGGSRGGGGGGRDRHPPSRPAPSRPAPSRPTPSPHRDPTPVAPTAVAPPSILSRPTPSTTIGPSLHGDTSEQKEADELNRQKAIRDIIARQQEEKFGPGADPTKFGETISDIDRVMSKPEDERTIDDKLTIEEWEKEQDWEKVEELADRGESFEDIQAAMNKGLLMKEDAIRRQGLIERGLAAVMPKTKLESSLLGSLKKTFDPKKAGQLGLYADRQPTGTTQFAKRVGETYRQPDLTKQIAGKGDVISKGIAQYTGGKSMMEDFYENEPSWSKRVGDQLGTTLQTVGMNQDQLDAINKLHKRNLAVDQSTTDFFTWHPQKKHVERFVKDIKEKDKTKLFSDTPKDIVYGDPTTGATTQEIQDYINSLKNKHGTIKNYAKDRLIGIADGGRIDKPLIGRNRYI